MRSRCEVIDAIVAAKAKTDMVRESKSPHSTPTFSVRKLNEQWRRVYAYNKLNNAMVPAQTPIPRKDVLPNDMAECTLYSVLDLVDGYYQIVMRDGAIPITAYNAGNVGLARPLSDLLRKDADWRWERGHQDAFKASLQRAPVLVLPDETETYSVDCDASDFAIGCALLQADGDGHLVPAKATSSLMLVGSRRIFTTASGWHLVAMPTVGLSSGS
ncbi:hypothetical protein ON010_g6419 [Phytophthora cinnamomi]|nr:hypothetical protein ON010_g6419 [Phytophthora cinnamomi]